MSDKLNIRKALRVFHRITSDGQRIGNNYHLNGLIAYSDFDGYTLTIHNDFVYLDIFFHNKFSFTYTNRREKTLFLEKIKIMDKQ